MKTRTRWPEGTRVEFKPNAASMAVYSSAPAPGARGAVVAVSLGSRKTTYLPGPGGGLVYVAWDKIGVMGVSPIDLASVKKTSRTISSNPVLTVAERRALPASAYADPKGRRFPLNDMEHARAAVPKLNLWFKRGKISKDEYKEFYPRIMRAYSKFGLSANKAPLVPMPRVLEGGKQKSKPAERKIAVGQNPSAINQLSMSLPLLDKKQTKNAILVLNNLYLKGKVSDDEYRQVYEMIASAWKKFGIAGVPSNELLSGPAPNPSKRRLPVLQPYSEDWRKRRACGIAQTNPTARENQNDPSGMRAIMMRVMAKPNPRSKDTSPQMAVRMAVPEIGMQAALVGKNISSLDPMEYVDTFLDQGQDPDAAMASLEDMASWGVTDDM